MINADTCERCGLCVAVCPNGIPVRLPEKERRAAVALRAKRLHLCVRCGHCMAICPTGAVSIDGLSYDEHIFDLPAKDVDGGAFFDLLASRRSIRTFKDTPVPRELLQEIVEAIATAPMGYPPHKVEVTVVQRRETIEQALPVMVKRFEDLGQWMQNPFMRLMVRRRAGRGAFNSLRNHVLPSLALRLPDMKAGKGDIITRGAPALLLFHAHREADSYAEARHPAGAGRGTLDLSAALG